MRLNPFPSLIRHAKSFVDAVGLCELHAYIGGIIFAVGAGMAYLPAGFMSFGALLVYLGLRSGLPIVRGRR